jgi:hypothetical protein
MARMALWSRLLLVASVSSVSFACSDDEPGNGNGNGGPDVELEDVVFVNDISDEALERMVEETPVDEASERLVFETPMEGEVFAKGSAPTFKWQAAESAHRHAPSERSPWRRFAHELKTFVAPIGVAHAHGPAYSGTAYFLVFSTAEDSKVLRVFTSGVSFTPDPESWEKLVTATGEITLDVSSAVFEKSLLADNGGPFVGATVRFRIE